MEDISSFSVAQHNTGVKEKAEAKGNASESTGGSYDIVVFLPPNTASFGIVQRKGQSIVDKGKQKNRGF